jgi:hypothetical protein
MQIKVRNVMLYGGLRLGRREHAQVQVFHIDFYDAIRKKP